MLFHLVADHHRRNKKLVKGMSPDLPEPAVSDPSHSELDHELAVSWRDEVLARSWSALSEIEQRSGQPYFQVLRFRAQHPDLPSPRMAEELSRQLDKPLKPEGVRQLLHRARAKVC